MPSPYLCERFHPTRVVSESLETLQVESLFLNFANATPRMQFAKAAPPGFERETRGRPIVTLFCRRALNEHRHHG
jgi:hypothetical protein